MIIDVLLNALLLSFILLGIHSYFGIEIVKRGIIFTDIAIAQFSAVGIAISYVFFNKPSYIVSLLFSLLVSLLVFLSQKNKKYSEAFIGLLYACGIASVFLILSKSPHSMEEFTKLTAGDILFIPINEILKTGIFYAFLGFILYLNNKFMKNIIKEVLFFIVFALTVTSSVKLVGVFVVFSILVAPALIALILERGLVFAWIVGSIVNTLGVLISFIFDLPTGFTLVFFNSLTAILIFLFKSLKSSKYQES